MQITRLAVVAGAVSALALGVLTAAPASADYAPGPDDVVGVGSDTVQYAIDFLADGDYTGSTGYNNGKRNRVVNFDATPDANARSAYGAYGLNGTSSSNSICAPGTGITQGTGNAAGTHTGDRPCFLNPTIVLRAGLKPVLRPNGSGAGFDALKADDVAGTHNIDFSRASSARTSGALYDSVKLGSDDLAMMSAAVTNAVPLSVAQLKSIYECSTTHWTQIQGSPVYGNTPDDSNRIIPLMPQVGSGTQDSFAADILGNKSALPGSCVVRVEENDPEAIKSATWNGVSHPENAIEPMSSGRLNMYLGQKASGESYGLGGYFQDPSCKYTFTNAACQDLSYTISSGTSSGTTRTVTTTAAHGRSAGDFIKVTTGDANYDGTFRVASVPSTTTLTYVAATSSSAAASLTTTSLKAIQSLLSLDVTYFNSGTNFAGTAVYKNTRTMYVYFRHADISTTKAFQPGTTRNWVRTLFYNPCSGTDLTGATISSAAGNCVSSNTYGPGGAPYLVSGAGRGLVAASGIDSTVGTYGDFTLAGP